MVKKQLNIPMCLAFVLLCLTLISMHFTGNLYAKYISKDGADDSARVARFNVDISTGGSEVFEFEPMVKIRPNENGHFSEIAVVNITNSNEVAVRVHMFVEKKTDNIPFKLRINESEDDQDPSHTYDEQSIEKIYEIAPNGLGNHKLIVCTDWQKEDSAKYMGMVDLITIRIEVEQID